MLLVGTHADPRQGSGLRLPEMLVGVHAHLIDLQTLGVIFVVEFTHHHDALGACLVCEEMEIEQHHLALELRKRAHGALVVGKLNVDDARCRHLARVDGLCSL